MSVDFLAFYDEALPEVYGYLSARCPARHIAEELTSETFLAAVDAAKRSSPPTLNLPWVIGVARHKLVDHWRRQARDDRRMQALLLSAGSGAASDREDDPWDATLDALRAHDVLDVLAPHHRAALTLRYIDDLSVPEVAAALDRTVDATEALLVRARKAFRKAYTAGDDPASEGKEARDV